MSKVHSVHVVTAESANFLPSISHNTIVPVDSVTLPYGIRLLRPNDYSIAWLRKTREMPSRVPEPNQIHRGTGEIYRGIKMNVHLVGPTSAGAANLKLPFS